MTRISLLLLATLICSAAKASGPGDSILYVGHRGASHLAPENTLASITLAWELGADAAECDVMLSADYQVLVFHDRNTRKLTGADHVVSETPWETLRQLTIQPTENHLPEYRAEPIPLLKDVLPELPPGRMLVIEIKTGTEILPYLKEVLDASWNSGRISFIAFDFEIIAALKKLYPEIPCYFLAMFRRDVNRHFTAAVEAGLDGLDLRYGIIDRKLAGRCREVGLDLWCWTVNDPETALEMRSLGVSAITTDRPAWLREQIVADSARFFLSLPFESVKPKR
jgi:glycerophosphoryl diester phosphodiesterase